MKIFRFKVREDTVPHVPFGRINLVHNSDFSSRVRESELSKIFGINHDGALYLKHMISTEFGSEYDLTVCVLSYIT